MVIVDLDALVSKGHLLRKIEKVMDYEMAVGCNSGQSQKFLYVLVGHIFAGISELMDDAVLDFRFGKYGFNGSGKSGQIVRASDENVLNSAVFQAV